jgi:hypothetical protein
MPKRHDVKTLVSEIKESLDENDAFITTYETGHVGHHHPHVTSSFRRKVDWIYSLLHDVMEILLLRVIGEKEYEIASGIKKKFFDEMQYIIDDVNECEFCEEDKKQLESKTCDVVAEAILAPVTGNTLHTVTLKELPELMKTTHVVNLRILPGSPRVVDLSLLASLPQLRYLDLSGCKGVVDLSFLKPLTSLVYLNLMDCTGVNDISPLVLLSSLSRLELTGCSKVTDFSPLALLTSLVYLDLSDCTWVDDLSFLKSLTSLRHLELSGCLRVADFSPVAPLKKLRKLYLCGRSELPVSLLMSLTSLRHIYLSHCKRLDITKEDVDVCECCV